MPSVRELFATIGMDVDTTGFVKAQLAVEGIKYGLGLLRDGLQEAARGMVDLIVSSAKTADDIGDLADRTGVSADALQRLGYGAKLSGVSIDQLAVALNFMAKKGVKDVEGGLSRLADQIQALPNDGSRAKAAIKALGKSGAALLPFLKNGAEGIKALSNEADALGIVMDETTLKQGGQFSDTWDAIGMAFQAVGRQLAFEFIPDLLEVAKATLGWIKENKELIKTNVREFAVRVGTALERVWKITKVLWQLLRPVRALFGLLADHVGLFSVALGVLTIAMLPAIFWIGTMAASLWALTAAELAAAAIPILLGLALLGLAAIVAIVAEDIYQFFTGGESLTGDFVYALQGLPDTLLQVGDAIGWAVFGPMWEMVKEVHVRMYNAITEPLVLAYKFWKELFESLIAWVIVKVASLGPAIGNGLLSGVRGLAGLIPGGTAAVDAMFGGGASPAASVAASAGGQSSMVSAPQFNAGGFTINATPGMNEQAVADLTAQKFEDFLNTKNREALAAVGEAP